MKKNQTTHEKNTNDQNQPSVMPQDNDQDGRTEQDAVADNESSIEEEADELSACRDKIAALEKTVFDTNEKFLRLFSEFDNYRKRTSRERIELTKTAGADIIASLLPVLDDLERACKLEAAEVNKDPRLEGIMLIQNKFKSALRQKGVEEIAAVGEEFNTDFHEAITHIPAADNQQKGTVIEEVQKGYTLNGKVIRYARVVVAN
jgi:molecular chaperone GrpE